MLWVLWNQNQILQYHPLEELQHLDCQIWWFGPLMHVLRGVESQQVCERSWTKETLVGCPLGTFTSCISLNNQIRTRSSWSLIFYLIVYSFLYVFCCKRFFNKLFRANLRGKFARLEETRRDFCKMTFRDLRRYRDFWKMIFRDRDETETRPRLLENDFSRPRRDLYEKFGPRNTRNRDRDESLV